MEETLKSNRISEIKEKIKDYKKEIKNMNLEIDSVTKISTVH